MMHLKKLVIFSFQIFPIIFFGCKKELNQPLLVQSEISKEELSYIDSDDLKIYEVIHIEHDDEVDRHDTITYLLKQEVLDTFIDNTNTINRVVNYYKFDSNTSNWIFYKKGLFSLEGNSWIKKNDNIARVALKFPFSTSLNWNSFAYNDVDPFQLQYKRIHHEFKQDEMKYDSTVIVGTSTFYTMVDFKKQFEIYAKHKGMIYSYSKNLVIRNYDTLNVRLGEEWYYTLKNK